MALPVPVPDRTAVVTGASSGIGAEIARLLAARGLGVTLVARREGPLRSLADELTSSHRVRAEVVVAEAYDADHLRLAIAAKGALAVIPTTLHARSNIRSTSTSTPSAILSNVASQSSNSSDVSQPASKSGRNYRAVVTLAAIVLWMR
jgi:NAD(P)-dependent dehydrogenase (short-subunit alcohol dehydrogenase family)